MHAVRAPFVFLLFPASCSSPAMAQKATTGPKTNEPLGQLIQQVFTQLVYETGKPLTE
jgi:hypothetical protein